MKKSFYQEDIILVNDDIFSERKMRWNKFDTAADQAAISPIDSSASWCHLNFSRGVRVNKLLQRHFSDMQSLMNYIKIESDRRSKIAELLTQ